MGNNKSLDKAGMSSDIPTDTRSKPSTPKKVDKSNSIITEKLSSGESVPLKQNEVASDSSSQLDSLLVPKSTVHGPSTENSAPIDKRVGRTDKVAPLAFWRQDWSSMSNEKMMDGLHLVQETSSIAPQNGVSCNASSSDRRHTYHTPHDAFYPYLDDAVPKKHEIVVRDLTDEEIKTIPLNPEGKMTSIGSIQHQTGECHPCAFHNNPKKEEGCANGIACPFCHFHHEKRKKSHRPSRDERNLNRRRKTAAALVNLERVPIGSTLPEWRAHGRWANMQPEYGHSLLIPGRPPETGGVAVGSQIPNLRDLALAEQTPVFPSYGNIENQEIPKDNRQSAVLYVLSHEPIVSDVRNNDSQFYYPTDQWRQPGCRPNYSMINPWIPDERRFSNSQFPPHPQPFFHQMVVPEDMRTGVPPPPYY